MLFLLVTLIITLLFLIVFTYYGNARTKRNEPSSDFLVSVLSVLVTMLIGWNIYQAIDFERKTKELNLGYLKLETELKQKEHELEANTAASLSAAQAEIYFVSGSYITAFQMYLVAYAQYKETLDTLMTKQLVEKAGKCVRRIAENKPYVIDRDMLADAGLLNWVSRALENEQLKEYFDTLNRALSIYSRIWEDHGYTFVLHRKDTPLHENEGRMIYSVLVQDQDGNIASKKAFWRYSELIEYIMKDLASNYDYIGVCQCNSFEEVKQYFRVIRLN